MFSNGIANPVACRSRRGRCDSLPNGRGLCSGGIGSAPSNNRVLDGFVQGIRQQGIATNVKVGGGDIDSRHSPIRLVVGSQMKLLSASATVLPDG